MALSFFRRRQKMVVIVMAFLMVSFLIGPQLSQKIKGCRSSEYIVGTAFGSDVTHEQAKAARFELRQLQESIGVGNPYRNKGAKLGQSVMEMHAAMAFINASQDPALTFLLLAREAAKDEVKVSEGEVSAFLGSIGLDVKGQQYTNRLANLVEDGIHEEQFRAIAAKWLTVWKSFNAATVDTPPSIAELKLIYRDLNERIKLRVLRVSADDMLDDVKADPDRKTILKQFNDFRNMPAGKFTSTDSFAFGYRQPHRVSIGYLLVDGAVVRRVTRPSDRQARDYWNDRDREFYKQVAIPTSAPASEPATSQASQPASAPATRPVEYKQELITEVADAMDQIRDILADSMTETRMDSVANLAAASLAKIVRDGVSGDKDYERLLARMTRSADSVLNRTLKDLDIDAEPLDKAVAKIAAAARLDAICYPWGSGGLITLSPDILVTLQPKVPITLRDALDQITRQAFGPQTPPTSPSDDAAKPLSLKWAMCAGFDDMLFPLGGDIEMFPLKIGSTPLMTREELQDHEMLASCSTSTAQRDGKALVDLAFQVGEFFGKGSRNAALHAGKDGPPMILLGARRGRVLWRPLKAVAAHVPTELTPELRKQIIADLRIKNAYDIAEGKVQKILAIARAKGLSVCSTCSRV